MIKKWFWLFLRFLRQKVVLVFPFADDTSLHPNEVYVELCMILLLTDDESILEYLATLPYPRDILNDALTALWQAAWETRAQDWKSPWARQLAWHVLLHLPHRETENLRLFQRVIKRERDWYVLQKIAQWIPSKKTHRQELVQIWQQCLASPYPVHRLLAGDALLNLNLPPEVTGNLSDDGSPTTITSISGRIDSGDAE